MRKALTQKEANMLYTMASQHVAEGADCWRGDQKTLDKLGGTELLQALEQKGWIFYQRHAPFYLVTFNGEPDPQATKPLSSLLVAELLTWNMTTVDDHSDACQQERIIYWRSQGYTVWWDANANNGDGAYQAKPVNEL